MEKIPVTIDKSHLITIGERLYTESVELLRELVNNAYDADASEVKIEISGGRVVVEDDGSGMDLEGLRQYFNIGSTFKREHPKSPRFGRARIGEFGIGKFSVLSACERFEVFSRRGAFAGTIIFDKKDWNANAEEWQLPLRREEAVVGQANGSRVVLEGLRKEFDLETVERRLIETLPLKAPEFAVFLNGKKLVPRAVSGRKIPFLDGTDYGVVHGEVVILPASRATHGEAGILLRVKGVAVRRFPFGMEPDILQRVSGEVNADFLPLTTDRNDVIRDSPEFAALGKVMERVMVRVRGELDSQYDRKENTRIKRALKEVSAKIEAALTRNRDWCPPGLLPLGDGTGGKDMAAVPGKSGASAAGDEGKAAEEKAEKKPGKKKKRRPRLRRLTPSAMVKKMKIGQMNLALVMDHYGSEGPESFLEGDIIYINRDHPLYQREARNRERHIINIARLICQEISLMSKPRNPRHAYERQSKLMKDAFISAKKPADGA